MQAEYYEVPDEPSAEFGERCAMICFEEEIGEYVWKHIMSSREMRLLFALKTIAVWTEELADIDEEFKDQTIKENHIRAQSLLMWAGIK